jgi:hypothetical protein
MALQTSVSGWDRRGRRPLHEKWRRHRGVSVPMCRRWPEEGRAWGCGAGRWGWLLLAQGGRRSVGPVLGHKAGWAVLFAGLARQGEEGEMGGLHRGQGPKFKRNRN